MIVRNSGFVHGRLGNGILAFADNSDPDSTLNFDFSAITTPDDALSIFSGLDPDSFDLLIENSGVIQTSGPVEGDFIVTYFDPETGTEVEFFSVLAFHAISATSGNGLIHNQAGGVIGSTANAGAIRLFSVIPATSAPGANLVLNEGEIIGNIFGSDGQELIYNQGMIDGSIALGLGDDLVIFGPNATLTGDMTLGEGDDIFVLDTHATLGGVVDGGVGGDDFLMLILGGTSVTTDSIFGFERVQTFGAGPLDNIDLTHVSEILVGDGTVIDLGSTGFGGEMTVLPNGKLIGNGDLAILTALGIVSPGESVGTINVAGDTSFDVGSVYEVEVNATASDQIIAGGMVTLTGGTVTVAGEDGADLAPGLATPDYIILSGAGGLTGEFAGVSETLLYYRAVLGYTPTEVVLTLNPIGADFPALAQTANEAAVGAVLHGALMSADGDFATALEAFPGLSDAAIRSGLNSVAGDFHAAGPVGASQIAALSAQSAARGDDIGAGETSFWAAAFYNTLSLDGVSTGTDLESTGALLGAERGFGPGFAAGVFGGYTRLEGEAGASAFADPSGYVVGASLRAGAAGLRFNAQGGYLRQEYDVARSIQIGALNRAASSEGAVDGFFAAMGAEYEIALGGFDFTPFAEFALASLDAGAFSEAGGSSLNLTGDRFEFDRRTVRAGGRLSVEAGGVTAGIEAGYQGELGDRAAVFSASLAGAPAGVFLVESAALSEHAGFAGVNLAARIGSRATVSLGYRGDFGDLHTAHGGAARLSLRF